MKVETFGSSPDLIAGSNILKFVLSEREGVRMLTLARPGHGLKHIKMLPPRAVPVGGGEIVEAVDPDPNGNPVYRVEWGSGSFLLELDYDRPRDPAEAARAIEAVRDAFLAWQKQFASGPR